MRAYTKDVIRSIIKGRKRFFAIMLITALGVCMFGGIKAGCDDLRYSADVFFDKQNLYDISIVSTLGLTDEDIEAAAKMEGVEAVEGTYTEDVYTVLSDGSKKQATVKTLSEKYINTPYLLEGRIPLSPTEMLVTEKYLKESGKAVGDIVHIEEDNSGENDEKNFKYKYYEICGVVIDVTDINSTEGAVAFRNNSTTDYIFFVRKDAIESEVYTAMYLTLEGTDELPCYSDTYEQKVDEIVSLIEDEIKEDREQARYDKITGEAWDEIADAEEEMWEKFADAESEIADAKEEIADGWKELLDGEKDLTQAERDLKAAERELEKGERELDRAEAEYAEGVKQYEEGKAELEAGEEALDEAEASLNEAEDTLNESEKTLNDSEKDLEETYPRMITLLEIEIRDKERELEAAEAEIPPDLEKIADLTLEVQELKASKTTMEQEYKNAKAEIADGRKQIAEGRSDIAHNRGVIAENRIELNEGRAELVKAKADLDNAREQLDDSWEELEDGWKELSDGEKEIYDGWDEIADARLELEDGQLELDENVAEYESEKADALQELADAKQEVEDIKMTEWYITTRTSLSGYNNIKTDADCIEAIGQAFPILFMTIAILISLTTMSRMIEEDRGLIGTYKALGFTDNEIRRKYVVYALIACVFGGIFGDMLAYIVLPEIMFIVFDVMYQIPVEMYLYTFDILYGIGGIILFVVGIVGAAYVSCGSVLRSMPAMLMRAKPPSTGSRVLLERITPIWSKLSFLNKVTARNLFRYKKRLFMTLFGIAGCTALLLTGFTIKDTVVELLPLQYDETYRYDVMAVAEDNEKLLNYLDGRSEVRKYINTMISNVKIIAENGKEETVQLIVVPDDENISRYIRLYDEEGERQKLTEDDVFVTKNLGMVLEFEEEDYVMIQNMNLVQADVEVTKVVMNYLGNSIYMTESMYEDSFDEKFEPNSAYILLNISDEKQGDFVEGLKGADGILTVMGEQDMRAGFDSAFYIITMVVYIIIVLAGALAFVVLFTLATTNISERERELATIKVLGFYDAEVHSYVNKETLILTTLGIILGMPLGKIMGIWLMGVLEMPAIYFYPSLYPESYAYAAIIAICFALLVNLMTNKSLNKIDPVEALKSIE